MITAKVPKDIEAYKAKQLGPFTLSQGISIICAVGLAGGIWSLVLAPLGVMFEISFAITMIIALPILAFGFIELSNMTFYEYLRVVVYPSLISPEQRKVSQPEISPVTKDIRTKKEKKKDKKENKKRIKLRKKTLQDEQKTRSNIIPIK